MDQGVFVGEPLELIGGELVVAEPQGPYHAGHVGVVADALRRVLPPGWVVRTEAPVSLDDDSVPEPDVAVVPGTHADYLQAHPSRPALVIEISDTSLRFDRQRKGSLYARAGLPDYWIVNALERVVEVYRDPVPDPASPYGWRYRSMTHLRPLDVAELLGVPDTRIAVSSLLP